MNTNHNNKLIKLESLNTAQLKGKLQELSLDEVASIQGGMLALPEEGMISERLSGVFWPDFPCSPYPTKDGDIPWCAIVL